MHKKPHSTVCNQMQCPNCKYTHIVLSTDQVVLVLAGMEAAVCTSKRCLQTLTMPARLHWQDLNMQDMQQAGLLVGNDALFTEQDFTGYTRKIGNSIKENDNSTIGQFGRGALTAYSLSDTIQLLTGEVLMILDPHATRLPGSAPSLRGNLADSRDKHYINIKKQSPNHMTPFLSATEACPALPTLSVGSHYPGTVFRLAFRTPQAAATSLISQKSITANQFMATLQEFSQAAPDLLLFTRHIGTISIYVKESAASGAVLLHKSTRTISKQRTVPGLSCLALRQLTVTIQQNHKAGSGSKEWAVATSDASASGTDGVAALLHQGPVKSASEPYKIPTMAGRVYATMPLPFDTSGLPLHVNGAFLVQADRRKMWSGEGDEGKVSRSCQRAVRVRSLNFLQTLS